MLGVGEVYFFIERSEQRCYRFVWHRAIGERSYLRWVGLRLIEEPTVPQFI